MSLPPVLLVTGPAELRVRREGQELVENLRAEGDVEVVDVRASEVAKPEDLPDLRTSSLFGGHRVLLVRDAGEVSAAFRDLLLDGLEKGHLEATVILLATSTGRIMKLAKAVKDAGGRIDVPLPREFAHGEWRDLIGAEFSRHGRTASRQAVEALVAHAGYDFDAIVEKVAQVCAAAPGGRIEAEHVDDVVTGHGSRGSFAIADAMCQRRPAEAVTLLRGALESGDDPVMILGALAYRIRALVAVAARRGGFDPKAVGLNISSGQETHLKRDKANFGPGELTAAYGTLAHADAELKGGELPPELVIERAVVAIATPQQA